MKLPKEVREWRRRGGLTSAANMTPKQRRKRAQRAAKARWAVPEAFVPPKLSKQQRKERAQKAAAARWAKAKKDTRYSCWRNGDHMSATASG